MHERRAQGLCYNCDEKYFQGHRCQPKQFLLLLVDDPTETLDDSTPLDDNIEPTEPDPIHFQLSIHALQGHPSPRTLKFPGTICGQSVMVLVDTGSSHNVMRPKLAKFLHLPITSTPKFPVMVGNGEHIFYAGLCPNIPLCIFDHTFHIPFYLLDIQGADIVLGIDWLRTLGTISSDFSVPSMAFQHNGHTITLTGQPLLVPTPATLHQIHRLLLTDSVAQFHTLTFYDPTHIPHDPQVTPSTLLAMDTPPLLPTNLHPDLLKLLEEFHQVFTQPHGLPPPRPHDHHITLLPQSQPVNVKPYRYPHSQKEAMSTILFNMLQEGIVIPSTSPYSSPVLLVRKKDGSWRFCVDYRSLNSITIKNRFPIPTMDELLDELGNATIFTKIDLRSGYHQIRVVPEDTHKTAFRTVDGHYEFLVLPFGLTNAPTTFQAAMNDFLRPYLRQFVLVFFDDILIYSPTFTDHLIHLRLVLNLLLVHQFYAKLTKCEFGVTSVGYLGHVISSKGVEPDPSKIQGILDWPSPRSLSELRGFLGLSGFYRRFVRHYATHAAPLTDLLKQGAFTWSDTADTTFKKLKEIMTSTPVLMLPNFEDTFHVETDASGIAIGAVLSQSGHPITFFLQKVVHSHATFLYLCPGDVRCDRSSKKMASVLDWAKISHLHRPTEFKAPNDSDLPNSRTTKMGY
uniref:Retrovirus-related Pol polyprotein from transposon 17.6 n=2 Tax=Cajanus cajan TaxID=3821 RepID=A0A151T1X9_CAJCA|nr:Retrovirus-related Pol polyprotein from transposon 17.6 [Cajanus cajan]